MNGAGEPAVAAADVEDAPRFRKHLQQAVPKDAQPPREHDPLVEPVRQTHRRGMPSRLRKKLERIVWNPSVASVAPGMTRRIVAR